MGGCGSRPPYPLWTPYGTPNPTFATVPGRAPPPPFAKMYTPDNSVYKLNPSYPGAAYGATPLYL